MIDLLCEYLSVRYSRKLQISRLFRGRRSLVLDSGNICIFYLHVIKACLKVIIATFKFCHSKNPLTVMKNIFNSISIYSWKKYFLLKFFISWKMDKFPANICHFQYDHRFFFTGEMGNIRTCKEVRLQKFVKFILSG